MKTKRFTLKRKPFLMNRLMIVYSFLLTGIILTTMLSLSLFTIDNNRQQLDDEMHNMELRISNYIQDREDASTFIYTDLVGSRAAINNLASFLNLDSTAYFDYTQNYWELTKEDKNVAKQVHGVFSAFPDLINLYVELNGSSSHLSADRESTNGKKVYGNVPLMEGFTVTKTIFDQATFQELGLIKFVYSDTSLLFSKNEFNKESGFDALIFDKDKQPIYGTHYYLKGSDSWNLANVYRKNSSIPNNISKDYIVRENSSSKGESFLLLANKKKLWQNNWRSISNIIVIGSLLITVLLLTLHRTFKRYFSQIEGIVSLTQRVAAGHLEDRINLDEVEDELYDLSKALNFMIGSMNDYIRENYQLEIQQRDAHMQALQSQINPHFLYNTLEYIRMYALSKQQKELAEVVYAFSSLLRNNTTQEKTTTIKKELSFCEKYVYLYQMRYPDRVAYFFNVEPSLWEMEIPKFCIQPLVENYFVHGIDYTHNNNAISVKAYLEGNDVCILVMDNGKGMTPSRLKEVQENLTKEEEGNSIGLRNVYFRLKHFFKDQLEMTIESQQGEGTEILIRIIKGAEFLV